MADNNTDLKRKRPKPFYVGHKKKKRGQELLTPGMKGILVTCNEREKLCVREAYNVLNEYADKLYGPEHNRQGDDAASNSDSEDIEEALAKEVKELQEAKQEKRFQAVLSGANNVIFIKTNLPDSKDPTDLVHTILTDMLKTGCKKTRHCQRFLPIAGSCHANKEDLQKLAEQMFQSTFFAEDAKPSTFCVMYKSRNNSSMHRDDTIAALAAMVMNAGKGHTVNLNNPDLAICVEIIKNVCCMSVVKDLFKLRKYNIHEVNEQIFRSQNNTRTKDAKGDDSSIEKTKDNNQDNSTTDRSSHTESTTVENTVTANQDTVKA
ncbi:THUMP domain-containing protein 1-like [Oculina patagonica]